mmetsp:Transcript_3651/g.7171  ORF Transcript_3651/g.7171 Transcript_3651/m.7171 type:complete len:451 (-) Transcript_3651:200-1552(-)
MAQKTTGEGNDEELDQELELLRAMWSSEEELKIQRPPLENCDISVDAVAARLVAQLAPNTGGKEQSQYLRCEVVITVPCGYPGNPPQVRLGASSGLADARRTVLRAALEDLLLGDFAGLPGALPAVLEAAQERLTAWNDEGPVGECPVCLAGLDHGDDAAELLDVSTTASLLRLSCYHVLHAACFAQIWETEWLRQREDGQQNRPALAISEAVVACPECRQVSSWEAVPEIHPSFEHLIVAASIEKTVVVPENDRHDENKEVEEGRWAEKDEAITCAPSPPPPQDGGASSFGQQQQKSASARVDLFEVIMPRGLRTRLKPKWDARDQEGPVLRNGACGVVAEFVEGKDATYVRPEGTDYWLPLNGGRNNCKMVRIDQDMPRPLKAPSGWIHGEKGLGADMVASTSPGSAKTRAVALAATSSPADCKERKKKTKRGNAVGGYTSANKLLGA